MLRGINRLHGAALSARDGEIGSVEEVLFDDEQWTVRYVVVNTGGWLNNRKVLIPPSALGSLDWDRRVLQVNLPRDRVESSPSIDTDRPISRQMEIDYHEHFGWPYYYACMGAANSNVVAGSGLNMGALYAVRAAENAVDNEAESERARGHNPHDNDDPHLRSSKEVSGYGIVAEDGHIGHVEDLIIDDETWRIRYLAVDTRDWWPGKKVLLPPEWVVRALWPERIVKVDVTRDQVRNAPEWDACETISQAFEDELAVYYAERRGRRRGRRRASQRSDRHGHPTTPGAEVPGPSASR